MTTMSRSPRAARGYVAVSTPYAVAPGRLDAELSFDASDKRRAFEHRYAAIELTALYGVEYRTPWKLTPNWTPYREMTEGTPFGRPDDRRVIVCGPERAVARYLAALPRVLAQLEAAATRAARAFGRWRRSLIAAFSGHLDYEDPATLRVRAREFRTSVLGALVTYLRTPPNEAGHRDSSRPLWEQAATVAAEVWHERPVDPWEVTEEEARAVLARSVRDTEPAVVETPAAVEDEPQADAAQQLAADEHQVQAEPVATEDEDRMPSRAPRPAADPGGRRQRARRTAGYGSIRGHDPDRRPRGRLQQPRRVSPPGRPVQVRRTTTTRKAARP